ncbi:MAG: T9SS type A sorting domain-containing protein [candidate division KSB1 bacterium]|nr:T9SS type A sorting domain-containing protein [candidate division KSB1 bacterium]
MFDKREQGMVAYHTWHVDDGHGWRPYWYPSLFDTTFAAKPAYYAIQGVLEGNTLLPPTNFMISALQEHSLHLDWYHYPFPELAGYHIYRSMGSDDHFTRITDDLVPESEYTDSCLIAGKSYYYRIIVLDSMGHESNYIQTLGKPWATSLAPQKPAGLDGRDDNAVVLLNWNANSESDILGYYISRSEQSGGPYTSLDTLVSHTNFIDTKSEIEKTYYYVIQAVDSTKKVSEYSAEFMVSVQPTGQAPFGDRPFSIPGTLYPGRYDTGGQGISYHDTDSVNVANNDFRADQGVDCSENWVAWVNDGEWLEYTVNVTKEGYYDLDIQYKTPNDGRFIRIYFDWIDKTCRIDLPKTGEEWNSRLAVKKVTFRDIHLKAGIQIMRFDMGPGQYNLGKCVFTPAHTASVTGSHADVSRYVLYPNYPNPFNPGTSIRFNLPQTSRVELVIYDVLGREVNKLLDQNMMSGMHHVIWDARDKNGKKVVSGLYFCRMRAGASVRIQKMMLMR